MPLYFAYGSNMDVAAMAQRCPASRAIGIARLARHRFIIMAEGYASVVRDPSRTVHGLLWDLALADIPALDRYESLSTGLYTKSLAPVITGQGARKALVYFGRSSDIGKPRAGYMESVLAAAAHWDLPEAYMRELSSWLPHGNSVTPAAAVVAPAVKPRAAAPVSSVTARPRARRPD